MTSWGPRKIIQNNGKVIGAELIQCASVFDEQGDFCPAFNNITEKVEADQVILAIGQAADLSFIDDNGPLAIKKGLIPINPDTQETDMPGVFAGGDVGKGPGTIIDAISAGRRAARAIDQFLGGDGDMEESIAVKADSGDYNGKRERGFADLKRIETPAIPFSERHDGFKEVDLCFDDDHAIGEAKRCLQCDLELSLAKKAREENISQGVTNPLYKKK